MLIVFLVSVSKGFISIILNDLLDFLFDKAPQRQLLEKEIKQALAFSGLTERGLSILGSGPGPATPCCSPVRHGQACPPSASVSVSLKPWSSETKQGYREPCLSTDKSKAPVQPTQVPPEHLLTQPIGVITASLPSYGSLCALVSSPYTLHLLKYLIIELPIF